MKVRWGHLTLAQALHRGSHKAVTLPPFPPDSPVLGSAFLKAQSLQRKENPELSPAAVGTTQETAQSLP